MDKSNLTIKDHSLNAVQASILAVPVIGASLEKLIFGSLSELRMKRVEATLHEIGEMIREKKIETKIEGNEDFANLLESVTPGLSKSTTEAKRERFRNLILSAAQCERGDAKWADARLASRFLDEIDDPGMAILSAVHNLQSEFQSNLQTIAMNGCNPCIICQSDMENFYRSNDFRENGDPFEGPLIELGYSTTAIDIWADRLIEMGLILHDEKSRKINIEKVSLTDRGELLIRWTIGPQEIRMPDLSMI